MTSPPSPLHLNYFADKYTHLEFDASCKTSLNMSMIKLLYEHWGSTNCSKRVWLIRGWGLRWVNGVFCFKSCVHLNVTSCVMFAQCTHASPLTSHSTWKYHRSSTGCSRRSKKRTVSWRCWKNSSEITTHRSPWLPPTASGEFSRNCWTLRRIPRCAHSLRPRR